MSKLNEIIMNKIVTSNRKAKYEYFLYDEIVAGIKLTGTEIKSIRNGKVNLSDSYCQFFGDELFLINCHIAEYDNGTYDNHEPKRDRKLLLTKKELKRLKAKSEEKGFTIIATSMFFQKELLKVNIALARGKKIYNKKEDIIARDMEREMKYEE